MDELYREHLLERYKHPENRKKILSPTISKDDSNPLCGDNISVYVRVKNGKVTDTGFEGKGCVISQAAADILMTEIKNKTLDEVNDMTREEMLDLLGIQLTPQRVKCAMLALSAVKKGIFEVKK